MQHSKPRLQGCRVLVVEDEYFLAEDVATALRDAGAEVLGPVRSEEAALSILRETSGAIECAVLDINLQGLFAYSLADTLRAEGIPFLFATGYSESSVPDRFRDVPHWQKPFDATALVNSIPRRCPSA